MMSILDRIASSPERMKSFQRERLEMEITELICQLMEQQGLTRAELATRLGKSRPYVTKLLRDGSNMTVKTISDVFFALGHSLRVVERPLSALSPRLFVMEAPLATRRVVPGESYQSVRTFSPPQGFLDSSPQPSEPEAA